MSIEPLRKQDEQAAPGTAPLVTNDPGPGILDIMAVLWRRRFQAGGIALLGPLLAGAWLMISEPEYPWQSALEIGTYVTTNSDGVEVRLPLEKPETVEAEIRTLLASLANRQLREEGRLGPNAPDIRPGVDIQGTLVSITSQGTGAEAPLHDYVHSFILDTIVQRHSRLVRDRIAILNQRIAALQAELDALNSDLTRNDRILDGRDAQLRVQLQQARIEADIRTRQSQLALIGQREQILQRRLADIIAAEERAMRLEEDLVRNEAANNGATFGLVWANNQRAAMTGKRRETEEELEVELPARRAEITAEISDLRGQSELKALELETATTEAELALAALERNITSKQRDLASLEEQLNQIAGSEAVLVPQAGTRPVGPGPAFVLLLGLIAGIFAGIAGAALLEAISRINRDEQHRMAANVG